MQGRDAHRFAKLACDLVEKHGFIAYQAKAYTSRGISPGGENATIIHFKSPYNYRSGNAPQIRT